MAFIKTKKLIASPIYGVSWDGSTSPAFTRTDDAVNFSDPIPYYSGITDTPSSPFDNISPWKDMIVSEDTEAGTLVAIPKFYYKMEYANPSSTSSKGLKIQISMTQHTGFLCSPAHMDRGDGAGERSVVYIGRYKCASTYKSTTGVKPVVNKSRGTFRTSIHNLGTKIWQNDYALRVTIWLLYLVEFANWNSQACIGYGGGSNSVGNMGYTDNMPYHTGITGTSRTKTTLGIQYRNIEGLWENAYECCDGIRFADDGKTYCFKDPSTFGNTGGTLVGTIPVDDTYFIKSWNISSTAGFEYVLLPVTYSSGSASKYICDLYNYSSTYYGSLSVGGRFSGGQNNGLFALQNNNRDNGTASNLGSRLMKLP